jgi:ribonuclease P protein component
VYEGGFRVSGPYFAAFCLKTGGHSRARVGLTAPKSLGTGVVRNRLRRRMREAVRRNLSLLSPPWDVVFNPRRSVLEAPFEDLQREVRRVFETCEAS